MQMIVRTVIKAGAVLLFLLASVGVAWGVSEPTALSWRDDGIILNWYYDVPGDYDQNGEVNIADVTALGVHFGKVAPDGAFPADSIEALVDGDGNGEINIQDLTVIGANFACVLEGYDVVASLDSTDFPVFSLDMDGPGSVVAAQPPLCLVNSGMERALMGAWVFELPEEAAGQLAYFWVRPRFADGLRGAASAMTERPADHLPLANENMTYAEWDAEQGLLRWYYFNLGDYDLSGEVNLGDLTPLGIFDNRLAEHVLSYGGLLDGNLNGIITLEDREAAGQNMANTIGEYNIYATQDPALYPDGASQLSLIETVSRGNFYNDRPISLDSSRGVMEFKPSEHVPGTFYWVEPVGYWGAKGAPSNLVSTPD